MPRQDTFTLGLDFGTNSVRALIVRTADGVEAGTSTCIYPSGREGVLLDPRNPHVARQHPGDYLEAMRTCVRGALEQALAGDGRFAPERVIGIGVDSTGSSPIPVDGRNRALGMLPQFRENLAAQCWLWKDHTSHREAAEITRLAREHRPQYVAKCGNTYSSEWWWSKIWHCAKVAPEVFDAAFSWVELADWVPSVLAGVDDPRQVRRGVCAAGHKALFAEAGGGLPDKDFLAMLDPRLADLRDRLYERAGDASEAAGALCEEWARALGLPAGIPVAMGEFDVHYGAIGSGVEEGVFVKVIGTSTCDVGVAPLERQLPDIPGICGIVRGSILPGNYGLEAGQSAVGDIFKWWVEGVCQGSAALHAELTEEAARLRPGESGLLALDWNNGNRTVLVDQRLTGLILGQTLATTRAEIYRALIEATAFGARAIVERFRENGVRIDRIVCAGGIAEKNALLMQIYADVLNCPLQVSRSAQTCALGSAVAAAVLAGEAMGGHADFRSAQRAMTGVRDTQYRPDAGSAAVYERLYGLYRQLHDAFGGVNTSASLGNVMKDLLDIKEATSQQP